MLIIGKMNVDTSKLIFRAKYALKSIKHLKFKYLLICTLRSLRKLCVICPVKYPYRIFALQKNHRVFVKPYILVLKHSHLNNR